MIDVAAIGAFEVNLTAKEGATDDELVGTSFSVERDSTAATSTGIDSAIGDNPGIEMGDGLVDVDIASSNKNDLWSEVFVEDLSIVELDVSANSEVASAIDDERSGRGEVGGVEVS